MNLGKIIFGLYFCYVCISSVWGGHVHHLHESPGHEQMLLSHHHESSADQISQHCEVHCERESLLLHLLEAQPGLISNSKNEQEKKDGGSLLHVANQNNSPDLAPHTGAALYFSGEFKPIQHHSQALQARAPPV